MKQFKNWIRFARNLISKTLRFGEAVLKYSEDDNSKFTGGTRSRGRMEVFLPIDQLDKDLVLLLKNLKVGEVFKTNPLYRRER